MQQLEVFVGGDIVHRSELDVLRALSGLPEGQLSPLLIMANLTLSARQIDFIIVSERGVHVVDAKSSTLPVRGGENGDWSRLECDGSWSWYKNGYEQVLDGKFNVRNTLLPAFPKFYPEAVVVFSGGLPDGSTVTAGDFKAKVTDIPGLIDLLEKPKNNPLSLDQWRTIAKGLGLRGATIAQVLSPDINRTVRQYQDGFRDQYAPIGARWVPESDEQLAEIKAAAATLGGLHIHGASGCAKSLAATSLAVDATNDGAVVLYLAAKQYSGSVSALIGAEVAQVTNVTWPALIQAVQSSGNPLLIVLDGVNELKGDEAKGLLRGVRAISRRYGARLLVTSQHEKSHDLSGLASFTMPLPSLALKRRIAEAHARADLSPAAIALLPAVRSGIEAAALGELQESLPKSVTRVQLIDQYVRHRVGGGARRCMSALRELAKHLLEQTAFSLSEPAYDIALEKWGYDTDIGDALLRSGILVKHAGRISFLHEMYCYGCASVSYAHEATDDIDALIQRLNSPVFRSAASDVIAALDDEALCYGVLSGVTSSQTMLSALAGDLGAIAKKAALRIISDLQTRVEAEIDQVELQLLNEGERYWVDWKAGSYADYSPASVVHLGVIGTWAQNGGALDSFMALCRHMDSKLKKERTRLAEAAKAAEYPIKSSAYALAFHGHWGTRIGFSHIFGATQPLFDRYKGPALANAGSLTAVTPGELQFVVEHFVLFFGDDRDAVVQELIKVFRETFRFQPYHVQLALLHVVGWVREASQSLVTDLVTAIDGIDATRFGWAISSSVVDALRILGGLEDDAEAARGSISEDFRSMLDAPDSEETFEHALRLYCASYDHPFDYVYGEELHSLPDHEKGQVLRRALRAPSIRKSMSLRWLTNEVAEYGLRADLPIMAQFAGLPSTDNPMRQDEIAAFVTAVRVHGRLGAALPDVDPQNEGDLCFAALRTIVYAAEQNDARGSDQAWTSLKALDPALVLGCIAEVAEALVHYPLPKRERIYGDMSLQPAHNVPLLEISRLFAKAGVPAKSARGYPQDGGITYAMAVLGSLGDRGDLSTLRGVINHPQFAERALEAIKAIEARCG